MIRVILIIGAFLFMVPRAQAQFRYDANCRQAYNAILSLRFDEAHTLLNLEKRADPENLVPVYLGNFIDFLTLVIGEERPVYDRLKEAKGGTVKALAKGREDSPFRNFCLGEVHLQWALARIKFGDYTTAAIEFHKAYDLFAENETRYPSFLINKMSLGVMHVMISLVPDKYRWVSTLAGLHGSMDLGMRELRQVAEYRGPDPVTRMYKTQATFFLAFLTLNIQKNKREALPFLGMLKEQSQASPRQESPLLIYAGATILMRNGFNDEALALLQERHVLRTYPFYYLDYLEGMARLNKLDMKAAAIFEQFIANFRGQYYIHSAYQKLAWVALLKGDSAGYFRLIGRASQISSGTDEDKQAAFEAGTGIVPNTILLRSRLLFDGGYYNLAINELLNTPVNLIVKSKSDLLEYTYRLGRIYHEQGNSSKALENYRQTILRGRNEPWYFAAGAAYQMGLLYENLGDYPEAGRAYNVCLSINTKEYKTSLHQKAKAGLGRLQLVKVR